MESDPMVSVIIPTYNRLELLREAVISAASQDYRPIEIIVVDDGSTDGTSELMESEFGEVEYITIDHTGMPGKVRNVGAAAARGEYLAFLDSDDLWRPGKLRCQVDLHLSSHGIRFSHTGESWLRNGRTVSQRHRKHRCEGDLFEDSLEKCVIGPSTVMMEKSLFEETGGFLEDLEICEDYEYWIRLAAMGAVGYLPEELTVKRAGHGDQLSERHGQIEIFRITALVRLLFGRPSWPGDAAKRSLAFGVLSEKCRIYAAGCRSRVKDDEAEDFEKLAAASSILAGTRN